MCYVNGKPCICTLDQMAEGECPRDGYLDPFRQGDATEIDHLLYLNGEGRAASEIYA